MRNSSSLILGGSKGLVKGCMTSLTLSLDKRSLMACFNGIVLPHLDYADLVWGDQPGLTTQIKQLQSFQNRCANIVKANSTSVSWGPDIVAWVPLYARRIGHWLILSVDALKGTIPEHFDVFNSTMSTVIILEMVTCPKSAGQERNGAELKHIIKQLTTGPYFRLSSSWLTRKNDFINKNWNSFYSTILTVVSIFISVLNDF